MLEVCIDSLESAINAIHGGADELEVCSSLTGGGLTPSPGLVQEITEMVKNISQGRSIRKACQDCTCSKLTEIPKINVMIRCRIGSDFNYSEEEMDTMLSDIDVFKQFQVNRFVFGALTKARSIDESNCSKIIQRASPIPVTFHRAFDLCTAPHLNIITVYELGFDRLLTSGQQSSASDVEAIKCLKSLLSNHGNKIVIMPGAGVNCDNAKNFIDMGFKIVHSSCKSIKYFSDNPNELSMGTNDCEYIFVTDEGIVRNMKVIMTL